MDDELRNEEVNIEEVNTEEVSAEEVSAEEVSTEEVSTEEKKEYPDNVVELEEENEKENEKWRRNPRFDDPSMLMAYAGPGMNPMMKSMMTVYAGPAGPQQRSGLNGNGPSMMLVYAAPPFPNPFNGGPRTPAEPEADPEPSEDTCFCSMCGGKFPKTARFCPYCGYKNILNGGGGTALC